ncbi:unnamed protein product [Ilex paraguariensis]|uniref:Transposase n=1 Tax=Ilex paraguariensis TaxID=185542 RepID=A0ABC8RAR0_9AQUA
MEIPREIRENHRMWPYFKTNPDAKGLRGKGIDMIDELAIVCGNDQAIGEWACSGKDINGNFSRQMDVSDDEYTPVFDHNENMVVDDLGDIEVANNMARLVDAYKKSKLCVNYSYLYKAVMDVEALDIDSRMTSFEYLNADLIKARVFLIYPEEMRYLFLIRHLAQGGADGIN